jgi:signal transduction histidine kinase
VLIVLLALEAIVEVSVRHGSNDASDLTLWVAVPAIAVFVVPLFLRGRYPFGGPAVYWVIGAAFSFADGRLLTSMTSIFVLGMAAAYLLGNLHDAFRARVGLGVVVGCAAIIVYNAPDHSTSELVFIPLLFGICWLAGFALRERAEQAEAAEVRAAQAERERAAAARIAVAEERARIARELHDIVAHAVSVMVLQIGAVRHNLPDGLETDAEALRGVETTGRNALAEMRRLLGAMRREGDDLELAPQPGLDGLRALADEVGRAGLPVRLHVEGKPFPLPRAIDLSAYRIVQEGLTNALKHAGASAADVTVRYAPEELRLEVRDDGRGTAAGDGLGHGLVGVRERVKIYGGEMAAGTANGGGFVLSTRLPLAGERA